MEGYLLGNRYELIEKIGGGGMAVVYKARCRMLNRYVAIKILRKEIVNDTEMVLRFRTESQSVAKLSHPNIVSVFDVGEDNNILYIVMEYIEGITLKDTLDRFGALRPEETLDIALQIATALEHAHKNGIIHRDIKPHNIMITPDGIAKVTDFGIARASDTSSTLTNLGNAIGSANYFSPEQAKGGIVDAKTDTYSFGVTMYQMATGVVPFSADSPISVALMHLNEQPVPPIERNPECPPALNNIILKCMQKDPRNRYANDAELYEAIRIANSDPFMDFEDDFVDECEKTKQFKAVKNNNSATRRSKVSSASKRKEVVDDNKINIKKIALMIGGGVVAVVLIVALVFSMFYNRPPESKSFTLKDYEGLVYEDVVDQLKVEADWLVVEKIETSDEKVEEGKIISQYPEEGQVIQENGNLKLKLTVSTGEETFTIPDFANKEARIYKQELSLLGIKVQETEEYSSTIADDYVISVEPEVGAEVTAKTVVNVVISKGPEPVMVKVPKLVGEKYSTAVKLLKNVGLKVGTVTPSGTNIDNYIVQSQSVKANSSVKEKSSVDIVLATTEEKSFELSIDKIANYFEEFPVTIEIKSISSGSSKATTLVSADYNETDFPIIVSGIKKTIGVPIDIIVYVNGVECHTTTIS